MKTSATQTNSSQFVPLLDERFLENQRIAGTCVADVMKLLINLVNEKTNATMLELSRYAESEILKRNCTATFKNFKGFPEAVCISINNQLVHGVPTNYKLKDGDLVSFDFGATYKESIGDSATTLIFGEAREKNHIKLIEVTKLCLSNAINSIQIGKKIGVIGHSIYKTARDHGFNVITMFGGHAVSIDKNGIGQAHAPPFISNKSDINEGIRFQNGMSLAIEPLLVPIHSSTETVINPMDKWTVSCKDICAHEEHTIFIHNNKVEIITKINE